jgi:phage tail sheath protein FI
LSLRRPNRASAEWKYVNAQREFLFMEHSIGDGTHPGVFEPNEVLMR